MSGPLCPVKLDHEIVRVMIDGEECHEVFEEYCAHCGEITDTAYPGTETLCASCEGVQCRAEQAAERAIPQWLVW